MIPKDIEELHKEACAQGKRQYIDPTTGYEVMTELVHLGRGWCCGSGCRHCPYKHENVGKKGKGRKKSGPQTTDTEEDTPKPTLVPAPCNINDGPSATPRAHQACDVVFFSGGKDSFLAAIEVLREVHHQAGSAKEEAVVEGGIIRSKSGEQVKEAVPNPRSKKVVLLTTYDPEMGQHGLQKVPAVHIRKQAEVLGCDLILVPTQRGSHMEGAKGYLDCVLEGLALAPAPIDRLVFGDLHLEYIREWREDTFGSRGYTCHYPLWQRPYPELMAMLVETKAQVTLSSVEPHLEELGIKVGDVFDERLVARLPEGSDAFGEEGGFHTKVDLPLGPPQGIREK